MIVILLKMAKRIWSFRVWTSSQFRQ